MNPQQIQQMMKQAQQMQERLQKQMAELRVEGNAGGGMVTVVVNGAKQMQSLKIDPEVVSKDDVEMLQDLIVAAVNDAQRKADEELSQKMGGMLPPGLKTLDCDTMHSRFAFDRRSDVSSRSSAPPHRGAAAPARHRSQGRAAARVSHPEDAARAGRPARRRRCATSRSASPTARSATTSPTPIPAPTAATASAITTSSASSRSRRTSARSRRRASSRACITC